MPNIQDVSATIAKTSFNVIQLRNGPDTVARRSAIGATVRTVAPLRC